MKAMQCEAHTTRQIMLVDILIASISYDQISISWIPQYDIYVITTLKSALEILPYTCRMGSQSK